MVSISGYFGCNCSLLTLFLAALGLVLCAPAHEAFTSNGVVYRYHVRTTTVKPPVTIVRTVFFTAWASAPPGGQDSQETHTLEGPSATTSSESSPSALATAAPPPADPVMPTSGPGSCVASYDDTEPFSTIYLTAGKEDVGAYTTLTRTRTVIVSVATV
ncbi:AFR029Cp [Eremothecium gossypii ATCC 10895]|uniref:AFR029Cp n=1 Tax=Eremothecium gossypii (strain ATCC 10895 / CBS 109.51 / FGSC 9923 / NRRL Y-1056) TaxID=284811 RepID=Q754P3_EREGS|nr:AFR029Cp [Eremothecium gossypii ATCC 10895]AAS53400.2 AFR029Cp [Eremothecium gossypii ATCC 10895]AEY97711.1 FAFR029Cp [Eremothecium gossypii FDAG1]